MSTQAGRPREAAAAGQPCPGGARLARSSGGPSSASSGDCSLSMEPRSQMQTRLRVHWAGRVVWRGARGPARARTLKKLGKSGDWDELGTRDSPVGPGSRENGRVVRGPFGRKDLVSVVLENVDRAGDVAHVPHVDELGKENG